MSSWKEISRLRQDRSLVLQILQALFDIEARFPLVLGEEEVQFHRRPRRPMPQAQHHELRGDARRLHQEENMSADQDVVVWGNTGQTYRRVGHKPYTRRDGVGVTLDVWQSHCATCGQLFEFAASPNCDRAKFNRRCQAHKQPGVPVGQAG